MEELRSPQAANVIEELNARFKEHGLGRQYESDKIIRTDSKLIHEEAVSCEVWIFEHPKRRSSLISLLVSQGIFHQIPKLHAELL